MSDAASNPPPLECQWCGADLAKTTHKVTCRIVTGELPDDWLDIPVFLDRRKRSVMDLLTGAAHVIVSGRYIGNSHRRRMEALLRDFHARGLTIAECAHPQRLGRTVGTLKRYASRMRLAFPDRKPSEGPK